MFNLSKEELEEFIKGHPKAKSLKASPLPFPDLCVELFEGTSATGSRAYAPSSTRERTVISSSSSFTSQTHTTQDEVNEDDEEEERPNVDKPTGSSSRPKKKSKSKVDMDELALEMRGALQTLVARQAPSFSDCLQKLDALGLDPLGPLYGAPLDIFTHKKMFREAWVSLPQDPQLLIQWIERTGERLNFLE